MQESHTKVAAIFDEIVAAYDFANFSIQDFANWIAQNRKRPIEFWPLTGTNDGKENMMGFWAVICGIDVIVYLENTLPIHQLHIQLHELSHILCGHTTAEFDEWDQPLLQTKGIRMRKEHAGRSLQEEMEAEGLACLLFHEIQRHQRNQRLMSTTSSHPTLARHWHAMETAEWGPR